MEFYGKKLGLELATHIPARRVAFYWVGEQGPARCWVSGKETDRNNSRLHIAFHADLADVLLMPWPVSKPQESSRSTSMEILAPNRSSYPGCPQQPSIFRDPDGNLLEFLAMLPDAPQPETRNRPMGSMDQKVVIPRV